MVPAAPEWHSVEAMRSALPAEARVVAHWRAADAAFLAGAIPKKGIASVVRLRQERTDIRFDGERVHGPGQRIDSLDWAGVQTGGFVVLFHTEPSLARSVFSFETAPGASGRLRFVLTGAAPGVWEIWRNGWVVDPGVTVRAGEAVLFFEERPGSYFIRRLG